MKLKPVVRVGSGSYPFRSGDRCRSSALAWNECLLYAIPLAILGVRFGPITSTSRSFANC